MSFWQRMVMWLKNPKTYAERQREWASRFNGQPANPQNPQPLDPSNDPWRT